MEVTYILLYGMRDREIKFTEKKDAEHWDKIRKNRRDPQRQTNTPVLLIWFFFFFFLIYGSLLMTSRDLFLCKHADVL